jgi:glutamate-1-semialdehyde 2,1-aminomutase
MAAGLATLRGARYDDLERTGAMLERGLADAAAEAGREVAISRVGSLLTVFFCGARPTTTDEALAADRTAYARFFGAMLDAGVLLPPSQFEAWFVSLAHGTAEIDATIEAARTAFLT